MTTFTFTPDPFKAWKNMYDQLEKTWSKPMNEVLRTKSFAASLGATRDSYLTSQKMIRDGMEQYLKTLHMPSTADVARLASQVIQLETKLEGLEDRFESLEGRFDRLEGRFDTLEFKLDTVVSTVTELAARPTAPVVEAVVPSADEAKPAEAATATKRRTSK